MDRRFFRNCALWAAGGVVLALLIVGRQPASASMPYIPLLEFTAISSSAPAANANITFRTSLPAGHHLIGLYGLETPDGWQVAGHHNQLTDKVTAVGALTVNLDPDGNCNDGDSGSPQSYGPFPVLDQDPGGGGPHAQWGGLITDFGDGNPNTNWGLTLIIEQLDAAYTIDGFLTDAIAPAGTAVCTPEVFTLTLCGRANPVSTATTCGAANNPVVMTNPPAAGCHIWRLVSTSDSVPPDPPHSASPQAGVSIGGTLCDADIDGIADPSDNCPLWPNPSQTLPLWPITANDPDCDGFSTTVENAAGTYATIQCGTDAWPADLSNNTFSDITDVSALTAGFGSPVPPAPARYNIAPDPPDGYIDITDVSKMTVFFGLTCAPCPGDLDCDAVVDPSDNCPNWPNTAQGLPLWPIPANDPDCDGFSTGVENSAGTSPTAHCGPESWPADIDNNLFSDVTDMSALTANFGSSVPPAPDRHDIAPDPVDNIIDITDISKLTTFFGLTCS